MALNSAPVAGQSLPEAPLPLRILRVVDVAQWQDGQEFAARHDEPLTLPELDGARRMFADAAQQMFRNSPDSAISLFRVSRQQALRERDSTTFRWSYYGEGKSFMTKGFIEVADSLFALAAPLAIGAADSSLMTRVIIARITTRVGAGNAHRIAAMDSMVALAFRGDPDALVSEKCYRTQYQNEWETAERSAREGIALARKTGARRAEVLCHVIIAQRASRLGRHAYAFRMNQIEDSLGALMRDSNIRAVANNWLGGIENTLGHPVSSANYLTRALEHATRSSNLALLARVWLALGSLADKSDDRVRAARYLGNAEQMFVQLRDVRGQLDALGARGNLMLMARDLPAAKKTLLRADTLARRLQDPTRRDQARMGLIRLAIALGDTAEAQRLLAAYDAYWAPQPGNGWEYTSARFRGQLALRMRDFPRAVEHLTHALELGAVSTASFYSNSMMIAAAEACRGDVRAALTFANVALDSLDAFRAQLASSQQREVNSLLRPDPLSAGPASDASLVQCLARNSVADAFSISERVRDRRLRDVLIAGGGGDSAATRSEKANRDDGPSARRAVTLDQLRRLLPDSSTTVLSYVASDELTGVTLFAVSKTTTRTYTLSTPETLRPLTRRLRTVIESGRDASTIARTVGGHLLDVALRDMPANTKHLVIAPDADLFDVPWNTLETGAGPLGVRFAVSVVPSASVTAERWSRAPVPAPMHVLAYGAPVLAFDSLKAPPSAVAEARSVAKRDAGSTLRTGNLATETYLKSTPLEEVTVLHFAVHAQPSGVGTASNAGLIFLAPSATDDGFLEVNEIRRLNLRGALVVLSACGTAVAQPIAGEGARSLATAFLEAGAAAVLSTQWSVRDSEMLPLVTAVYDGIANQLPVDEALRRAQQKLRAKSKSTRSWSAFTLIGDGHLRLLPPSSP